jgi:hypothetical protein
MYYAALRPGEACQGETRIVPCPPALTALSLCQQDLPILQLGVGPLPGPSLACVGGVDLLLRRGEPPVAAGVGAESASSLRNLDRGAAALVGGVGDSA